MNFKFTEVNACVDVFGTFNFSEDDLLLLPKLSASSNKNDLKNFQYLVENYTMNNFLNSEIDTEPTVISGETHLLHDEGVSQTF